MAWPWVEKPHSRDHSQAPASAIASTKSDHQVGLARNSMPRTTGRIATAVRTRVLSTEDAIARREGRASARLREGLGGHELLAGAAEASLAAAIGGEGLLQRGGAEIGPQGVGEVELGVRELPEQEVGDALLAAGADEEVRLRRVGHRQARGEALFGDRGVGLLLAATVRGLQHVPAAAVVRGNGEREPGVVAGEV